MFEIGYNAVYIGSGAGLPNFMGIEGEKFVGVYSANEFLTRINLMNAHKKNYDTPILKMNNVAVVGGGNVAMDAARCAKRIGAENVYVIYRRSQNEMPARREEIEHAKEEGIKFNLLSNPIRILGDEYGRVNKIECVKMELISSKTYSRKRPIEIANSNFKIEVNSVIISIGNSPNPLIGSTTKGLKINDKGCILINESTLETSRKGVFAGGDIVTGAATVILAMESGRIAAKHIDDYINKEFS